MEDYVSQTEIARSFQQEPPKKTYSFEKTNTSTNDFDKVETMSNLVTVLYQVFDKLNTENVELVAPEIQNAIDTKQVSQKDKHQDDAYLVSLLEGLDDWDKF